MAQRTSKRPDFATVVRQEMRRQGLGYRGLARKIAGPEATAQQVDNLRGHIKKWVPAAGLPRHSPTPANRVRVADALGIDRQLLAEPDDEEDHQVLLDQLLQTAQKLQRKQRARQAGEVS